MIRLLCQIGFSSLVFLLIVLNPTQIWSFDQSIKLCDSSQASTPAEKLETRKAETDAGWFVAPCGFADLSCAFFFQISNQNNSNSSAYKKTADSQEFPRIIKLNMIQRFACLMKSIHVRSTSVKVKVKSRFGFKFAANHPVDRFGWWGASAALPLCECVHLSGGPAWKTLVLTDWKENQRNGSKQQLYKSTSALCFKSLFFPSFITFMKFCNRVRHCCFVLKLTCFARGSVRPRMRRSLQSLNASLSMCETLPLPSLRESKYREWRDRPSPVWSFMRCWLADGGRPEQITPSHSNLDRDTDFC